MADLLIKGMKMPKNCDECNLATMESEFHGICTAIRNDVCYVYPDKGKPEWCPLVEVPTHGRLIDADALIYQLAKQESVDRQPRAIRRAERIVANVPTVIEASEDGGEDETAEADYEWSEEEQAYIEQGYMDTQVGLPDLYMN